MFVNRRPVENRALNFALLEGYHTALMKGRYPVCCLFAELHPAEVDVNIHPAKREVRFHREKAVRRCVGEAVRRLGSIDLTYVIGDSWIDGAAAAASGARFIAYRRTAEDLRDRSIEPWRTIAHLSELLTIDLTR